MSPKITTACMQSQEFQIDYQMITRYVQDDNHNMFDLGRLQSLKYISFI